MFINAFVVDTTGLEDLTDHLNNVLIVTVLNGIRRKKIKMINLLFKRNREIVLKASDYRCSNCGNSAKYVHHLDKSRTNNDLENLVPVCSACHKLFFHIGKNPNFKNPLLKLLLVAHIPRKKIIELTKISSSRLSKILVSGKASLKQRKAFFDAFGIDPWEWDGK
jgi:hypothetical protein